LTLTLTLCWILSDVGIKGNEMADNAAKDSMCSVISQSKIPPESFFPNTSKLCMEEWQDSWDSNLTNKLVSVKPELGKNKPCTSLSHLVVMISAVMYQLCNPPVDWFGC